MKPLLNTTCTCCLETSCHQRRDGPRSFWQSRPHSPVPGPSSHCRFAWSVAWSAVCGQPVEIPRSTNKPILLVLIWLPGRNLKQSSLHSWEINEAAQSTVEVIPGWRSSSSQGHTGVKKKDATDPNHKVQYLFMSHTTFHKDLGMGWGGGANQGKIQWTAVIFQPAPAWYKTEFFTTFWPTVEL